MNRKLAYTLLAVILVIIIAGAFLLLSGHSSPKVTRNTCTALQFTPGSSGNCVDDIQTMVNFMETDGLTQCPFTGSSSLSVTGSYDANTENQVKVVQTWLNCYNKQEGEPLAGSVNGSVGPSTWSGLCTYAYQYPSQASQSTSPYFKQSLAAGKNAGC